jgi:arsenite-transporting ATPase
MNLLDNPTRILLFTGKGGVGKTTAACASALALADAGHRVLLVSTDPASNLDEVLGLTLTGIPLPVPGAPGLYSMNIDPEEKAREYREQVVAPYRGVLPESAVRSIEERLSGACTVEIAAFQEFSRIVASGGEFEHVVLDTAPTGHTLRLLELPAAWSDYLQTSAGDPSCLGPLSGLQQQKALFEAARAALADPSITTLVLVARPDAASLAEAERSRAELAELGVRNQRLVINGLFAAADRSDALAAAMEREARAAVAGIPPALADLPRDERSLLPHDLVGLEALRAFSSGEPVQIAASEPAMEGPDGSEGLHDLVDRLGRRPWGVVMTMGKGGVGKTWVARRLAVELARRGHRVDLTTTDPAGQLPAGLAETPNLRVSSLDPEAETQAYKAEIMSTAGAMLDERGRALLEEDLRSPCTEEIAVFRAFAARVSEAEGRIVVIDTAPTGHTLLLLDAAQSYHREVLRHPGGAPEEVLGLLPRLRDPDFTRVLLVTLPEATPVHEAQALERDLRRADIHPFAWVVNRSLSATHGVQDPLLTRRRSNEARYLREVREGATRMVVLPWEAEAAAVGAAF